LKFDYLRIPFLTGAPALPRPVLKVRVIGPSDWAVAWMLVDSGADETVLPQRFLERLGVSFSSERAVLGGMGQDRIEGKVGSVAMEFGIGQFSFNSRVIAGPDMPIPVLGHRDFFERYFVCFEAGRRQFLVSEPRGTR
jgi:hypothetical protein